MGTPRLTLDYFVGKKNRFGYSRIGYDQQHPRRPPRQGLTLEEVGQRCDPPTTAQTIGRLETGTHAVAWLDEPHRPGAGVEAAELVQLPQDTRSSPSPRTLARKAQREATRVEQALTARPNEDMLAVRVTSSIGDYRAGDEIWCRRIETDWAAALNRDLLVPGRRAAFLCAPAQRRWREAPSAPLGTGQRQQVVSNPPWAAVAVRLIRTL
jgi:hypothetical protein